MAQMVAKALVRQDRVDAEQNAIINRLANEFSAELNNLGVRVATLENKVGNFKFTGDARVRYQGSNDRGNDYVNVTETNVYGDVTEKTSKRSKFDYRGRVQFEATVNDNTKAVVRLATGDKEFGATGNPETTLDHVYVQHNFGKYATASVGRQDLVIGNGFAYDGIFEGAQATFGKDKLNASVAHGYMLDGDLAELSKEERYQSTTYQVNAKVGKHVEAKGFYVQQHGEGSENFFGGALDTRFGANNKIWAGAEYTRYESAGEDGEAWTAGIGYGMYDISKAGSWDVKAQYFRFGEDNPVNSTTYNLPMESVYDFKGWLGTVNYAVAKNVGLTANAQLHGKNLVGDKLANYYRAELNYKF